MRQGPWVVQRAVGTKPLIVGRALKVSSSKFPPTRISCEFEFFFAGYISFIATLHGSGH